MLCVISWRDTILGNSNKLDNMVQVLYNDLQFNTHQLKSVDLIRFYSNGDDICRLGIMYKQGLDVSCVAMLP